MSIRFTKMHGLGNDFILINCLECKLRESAEGGLPELARKICDRHFGVGSDGLILALPSKAASFRMRIFNSDGSEAEMCGNGLRCFASFVRDEGLTSERELLVETLAGIKKADLTVKGGKVESVRVDMGAPLLDRKDIPMKGSGSRAIGEKIRLMGERIEATCLSMGNPHCVVFVDKVDTFPVEKMGPALENHNLFPRRTNAEFVQVISQSELRMRVWERGAGETLACGTGASAAVVAASLTGRTGRRVVVHLPGGDLKIEWNASDDHVYMTGPVETVFRGEWLIGGL
jgi:diaminopimelate epimerase